MKSTKTRTALAILLITAGCASDSNERSNESAPRSEVRATSADSVSEREFTEGEMQPMEESADEDYESPAPEAVATAEPKKAEKKRKSRGDVARDSTVSLDAKPAVAAQDPNVQTGAEDYKDYGVNAMTKAAEDRYSTFSIDVDTGAYTIARRKLNEGQVPPAAAVRVEEFVNYFRYDYPSPDRGAFGVHLEAAPSPFSADPNTYVVRVGVQGKHISTAERKPTHLTFLVDVSGSMTSSDKLPMAKRALTLLTNNLREGDTVALATYAGRVAKILEPTGMHKRGQILEAIQGLESGGGTGMSSGMELAYKMALSAHKRGHVNRVMVLSDGDANIGPSSHVDILKSIAGYVEEGVTLSTIGFGMGNYKDTMMEQLANKGNGNYYYIDTDKEARKVFGEQLDGTLQVIAKDVKIQVEFDPEAIPSYRLIGYENRDIADKDFRNDRVDAGEIGAGHTVTALYEVKMNKGATGRLATVRIRHKQPEGFEASEQEFYLRDSDVRARLADASRDFQFASSVAAFAEILRKSPYAEGISLDLVEEVAAASSSAKELDRQEFLGLVRRAKKLTKG